MREGRSLKVLAIIVILLLSVGLAVVSYHDWTQDGSLARIAGDQREVTLGFAFLMLLTVGYLVGKGWATTRVQRVLIDQLLEEEAVARARRLDPITDFHHPEVCREILLRQCHYAARLHCAVTLMELTVPGLGRSSLDPQLRPLVDELIQEVKRLCRPMDFLLRWSPDSFLVVLPEVSQGEAPGVVYRIRAKLERWSLGRLGPVGNWRMQWRYVTTEKFGSTGDVLLEVRRLFEEDNLAPTPMPNVLQPNWASRD